MKPIPEGFAIEARGMTISQAQKRFKACSKTINMWADHCGDGLKEAMANNGKMLSRMNGLKSGKVYGKLNNLAPHLNDNNLLYDQRLMLHLQRRTRWSCYSSRIYGDTTNVYYVIGDRKLNLDELVALAQEYGFQE